LRQARLLRGRSRAFLRAVHLNVRHLMTPNQEWSAKVADLVVDALIDAGVVRREDFAKEAQVAALEINVRLSLQDTPPKIEA
jgi:hypothetical protein